MLDEKDLQAIAQLIRAETAPIREDIAALKLDVSGLKADVSSLKEDLADLKEAHEETRTGVNALLEWSESVSMAREFPLPQL